MAAFLSSLITKQCVSWPATNAAHPAPKFGVKLVSETADWAGFTVS
jgi:hypothetical protein